MYDVIVAGAGPAGCAAAKRLADGGLRVLLLERCALPRYKSCSGMLIEKSLALVRAYFGAEVPELTTCAPAENRGMILTDARGRELRFEQRGRNVWRSAFDGWLAQRATRSGAELRDETAALECVECGDAVTVRTKGADGIREECARWLIDCTGAAGCLRRGQRRAHIATFQTFNRGEIDLDPHYFYAYLQPELSGYDAWFNVKDDMLVLGAAAPEMRDAQRWHARFLDYMRREHGLRIEEMLNVDRWVMPRVRSGCPVETDAGRTLRAGEAAGFLNPMGEGISAALESGHLAAEALLRHSDAPELARDVYRDSIAALHAYMRRQWNLTAGLSERFAQLRM